MDSMFGGVFTHQTLGDYMVAILIVLFLYAAVQAFAPPEVAAGLSLVTLAGIILYKSGQPTPPGSQPQQHGNY